MAIFGKSFATLFAAFFGVCVLPFALMGSAHAATLTEGLNQLAFSSAEGFMASVFAALFAATLVVLFSYSEESPEEIAERIANA